MAPRPERPSTRLFLSSAKCILPRPIAVYRGCARSHEEGAGGVTDQQNSPDMGAVGNPDSIVAGVFGGTEQVKSFADNAKHFLDEAKAGRWAVDEETGAHIRSGIAHSQQVLSEVRQELWTIQQAPMVGNDGYAQKVAQHMLASVNSDEQSLVPVFNMVYDGLDNLRDAVDAAVKNYDSSDEAATKHFAPFKD